MKPAGIFGLSPFACGALAVLALMSGFFAFYRLSESPATWYDEGMVLQLSENLVKHGRMEFQLAPGRFVSAWHMTTGFPVVAPVALSFELFGVGIIPGRIVAVFYLFLLLAAAFAFMRRLRSERYALWAVFLLATFSSLYGNGKSVLGEVPGLALLFIFLYFLQRFEESAYADLRFAGIAGVFLGLALATKPTFLVAGPALCLALLVCYGRWRSSSWGKWLAWAALGCSIPLAVWVLTQFSPTDSFTAILNSYINPYNLTHIGSVIHVNAVRFLTESTPFYTLVTFLIWIGGLGVALRKRETIPLSEWCAFFFTILILLAYFRTPGWYRYLFPANIPILVFLPYALTRIARSFEGWAKQPWARRALSYAAPVALSALILFQGLYLIFGSWIASVSTGNQTVELESYFSSLSATTSVFVYDTPTVIPFLHTDEYWQYFHAGGVWTAGTEYLPELSAGTPDLVVVSPTVAGGNPLFAKYAQLGTVASYGIYGRK